MELVFLKVGTGFGLQGSLFPRSEMWVSRVSLRFFSLDIRTAVAPFLYYATSRIISTFYKGTKGLSHPILRPAPGSETLHTVA